MAEIPLQVWRVKQRFAMRSKMKERRARHAALSAVKSTALYTQEFYILSTMHWGSSQSPAVPKQHCNRPSHRRNPLPVGLRIAVSQC